jgi:hypothetical protein
MINQRFGQGVSNLSTVAELRTFDGSVQLCDGFWTVQVHLIFETGHGRFRFVVLFKYILALEVKFFWTWLKFSLIHNTILGRYAKNWVFHQYNIFAIILFTVSAWLSNHAVCKIGLTFQGLIWPEWLLIYIAYLVIMAPLRYTKGLG